ncbi:hypothetical protein HY405_01630 [Candidatus Microgenomates bacterium]|nr:hypothetical protein [Candidatus Microgenomates bacterium]
MKREKINDLVIGSMIVGAIGMIVTIALTMSWLVSGVFTKFMREETVTDYWILYGAGMAMLALLSVVPSVFVRHATGSRRNGILALIGISGLIVAIAVITLKGVMISGIVVIASIVMTLIIWIAGYIAAYIGDKREKARQLRLPL